ncbi:ATP-binding protein [Streptomyces adelaidensis]|uniref:ATP-binding protein n=1 Tax=Streptomyces adelaidensis TaxID=2796465 RepID=UPI001908B7EB|nr:ATP-binding protein [Streptomyces adelaidensis]
MDPAPTHPVKHPPQIYRLRTPNSPTSPKICRDVVALLLQTTGHGELVDTARLLVSELVTNVGLHTTSLDVRLEAVVRHDRVRVSVYDDELRAAPAARPSPLDAEAEHGRGLLLLSELAQEWGVGRGNEPLALGKQVWFELR